MATSSRQRPADRRRTSSTGSTSGPVVGTDLLSFVPEKFRSATWLGILLLSLIVFFGGPIFGGEYMGSDDNVSWESYRPYLEDMSEAGESPQWMPYIFSGMPGVAAYMVTGERSWDITMSVLHVAQEVFSFLNQDIMRVLFYYFLLGAGVFAVMRWRGVRRSVAFFSAFATIFSTWIIVWIMIGHNTKPMVLAFLPWVILFAGLLIDRWSLLWAGLLILAVHYLFESAHPQTALYGAFVVGIWWLVELLWTFIKEDYRHRLPGVVRAGMVGLAAAVFAIGMGWDRLAVSAFDYNEYSTRGAEPLVEEYSQSQDPYEYATAWSFDVDETFTYVVPSYFGFGSLELEVAGQPEQPYPTYWGNDLAPFTDAGHYMGIIVLLLALFGLWRFRSSPFAVGLGAAGLLGLFLSWGGNFPLLYDLFYHGFPLFGQFRAPSQSLVMLEFVGPILAGLGLSALIEYAKRPAAEALEASKKFLWIAIGAAVFGLIVFAIGGSWIENMASDPGLQRIYQGQVPEPIAEAAMAVMRTDWLLSALFAGLFGLMAWAYLRGKMKGSVLILAVIGLSVIDLWRVDARAMQKNEPREEAFAVFNETSADLFLKQDTSVYRIADLTRHPSHPAYFRHQHIGGYSAAKVRRYQDLMDATAQGSTSMPGPGLAWDLLNTKYVISQQPAESTSQLVHEGPGANVYLRPTAMPRAWFVDRVEVLDDREVIARIRDNGFDPAEVAYVPEPLDVELAAAAGSPSPSETTVPETGAAPEDGEIEGPEDDTPTADPESPQSAASDVQVVSWEPHEIVLQADADGTRFLVVSEIYYPPGWQATIDGEPVETYRADYLLRGLVVPEGEHTIRFAYVSENHETGVVISLILNIMVILMILVGAYVEYRRRQGRTESDPAASDAGTVGGNDA